MGFLRDTKRTLGLSMLISGVTVMASAIALAGKKSGVLGKVATVATVGGIAGVCLLTDVDEKIKERVVATRTAVALPCTDGTDDEMFTPAECRRAAAHIRSVLGGKHDDGEVIPRVRREVPRDEDASEDDFL